MNRALLVAMAFGVLLVCRAEPAGAACEAGVATGQTRMVIAGEDGNPAYGAPLSYTNNGDGTITDNTTGLMWEVKFDLDVGGSATNLHDANNFHPWRGSCSVSGAECGTDVDCPPGQTCDAGDGQTSSPNGLTIFEVVEALNIDSFAGYDDWRVPNAKEMQSIFDYGRFLPAIDPAFNGSNCGGACADITDPACSCTPISGGRTWSATTVVSDPTRAWLVYYSGGNVLTRMKTTTRHFRAVRGTHTCPATGQTQTVVAGEDGNPAYGAPLSYTNNGNGTITDNTTGLMWEVKVDLDGTSDAANLHDANNSHPWRGSCSVSGAECGTDVDCSSGESCDAGDNQNPSPNGRTIFEWVAAVNASNFAGHSDWRIPNQKELAGILDYGRSSPSIDPAFNGSNCGGACTVIEDPACSCTKPSFYWSATSSTSQPADAWNCSFGNTIMSSRKKTALRQVRAVRGGSKGAE